MTDGPPGAAVDAARDGVDGDAAPAGHRLARVDGDLATYQFTGRELYVRAVVRSDKPIPNAPAGDMQRQEAWCQPMGWHKPAILAPTHDRSLSPSRR